jgi:hypothetical protein
LFVVLGAAGLGYLLVSWGQMSLSPSLGHVTAALVGAVFVLLITLRRDSWFNY